MILGYSKWSYLKLSKIFTISKYGDVENVRALKDGNTNYISTSRSNNGLYKKVTNTNYTVEDGNCITVGIDGSFATFYQPDSFIRTTNIATLRCSQMNLYVGLFFSTLIKCALSKYYYGVKIKSGDILADTEVLVPVDDYDNPNWNFIEDYTKKMYKELSTKLNTKITGPILQLDYSTWKKVSLVKIFDYQRGQRYKKEDHKAGKYPYICSSEFENGIDSYVEPGSRSKIYHDCLTIANSGSRGIVFYHEGDFVASDHVTVLWRKDGGILTKKMGLFVKPIIEKNADRFLFNKEINNDTINEIELFLPYKNEQVDWDFMERYINSLPNSDLI